MKKAVLTISLFCFAWLSFLQAQVDLDSSENGPLRQRLEATKVGYMTEKIGLTPDQAKEFWPIYNQYQSDQKELRQKNKPSRTINQMSDEEVEQQIERNFEMEEKLIELNREYYKKFKEVINVRQIALMRMAERDFNKEVLRRMMEFQQKRRQMRNRK